MANKTIQVRGAGTDRKVILWERDEAHPRGEIMIVGDGQSYAVGETAAVKRLISEGRLVTGQTSPATAQTPATQTRAGATPLAGLGLSPDQEKALTDAGFADRAALTAASDDDLVAVAGVGKATVDNLRKALK